MTVRSKIEKFYTTKNGNHVESSVTSSQILLYRLPHVTVFVVAMEWTNYHVRVTIIGYAKQIHMLLKPLKVSECFAYRVLALFKDTSNIVDWPRSGSPALRVQKMWWKPYVYVLTEIQCADRKLSLEK